MMTNPTYELADQTCSRASDELLTTIGERLDADGTLRNGAQLRIGTDTAYVSAEFLPTGQDEHVDGDILTWVTDDLDGESFRSVDANAREHSAWPPADIDVTAPGARPSRACADVNLGKTQAQVDCEDSKVNGQAPLDLDCSDR
jgi:hypothetical protein